MLILTLEEPKGTTSKLLETKGHWRQWQQNSVTSNYSEPEPDSHQATWTLVRICLFPVSVSECVLESDGMKMVAPKAHSLSVDEP